MKTGSRSLVFPARKTFRFHVRMNLEQALYVPPITTASGRSFMMASTAGITFSKFRV